MKNEKADARKKKEEVKLEKTQRAAIRRFKRENVMYDRTSLLDPEAAFKCYQQLPTVFLGVRHKSNRNERDQYENPQTIKI